jgi:NAD(P)H-nitrite reductase large subunit
MAATGYDYAIVGNSAAAINACDTLREFDKEGSMAIFCEDRYRCYSRPLISYLVAGEIDNKGMYYRPQNYYRSIKADFHKGTKVESIDPGKNRLTTAKGDKIKWRKLLLATGFESFIPPIEGLEEVDHLSFISWDDAKKMMRLTGKTLNALVVGAGLIGVKAAEALVARAAAVTVVEMMDRVLPQALDDEASALVAERCQLAGIELITGEGVTGLESRGGHKGRAVLDGGSEIDFDLLVMAVGVRPRAELAEEAGLSCDRGIEVDEFQRTSGKDIYAAGDAVKAMDIVMGEPTVNALWPVAALQGKYAGMNMAGAEIPYPGNSSMNSVEFFGLPVLSAGIVNPPDDGYEVITYHGEREDYRKAVLKGDIIVGMLMAGRIERAGILTSLIQERANVRRVKNFLLEEGFGHINFPRTVRQGRIMDEMAGLRVAGISGNQGGRS